MADVGILADSLVNDCLPIEFMGICSMTFKFASRKYPLSMSESVILYEEIC